jgi:glycerophosphoryl diester phosphodiesterase
VELSVALLAGFAPFGVPRRNPPPLVARNPLLIAHRGGAGLAPENTMAAFRSAVDDWSADMIEFDVHATSDGRCIVIHDPTLDRTTDGSGRVADLPWDAVREFDAGYHFSTDGGRTHPFRGRGVRVPVIEEVFEALPTAAFTIEVKAGAAQRPLLEAIAKFGVTDRIILAGMYDRDRTRFHEFTGVISASTEQAKAYFRFHVLRLGRFWRIDADVVQIPEYHGERRIVTQRLVRELGAQGVPVHVWTVNGESDMHRLLDWGVAGLVTDRPDLLARVLHRRIQRPLPPGIAAAREPLGERR